MQEQKERVAIIGAGIGGLSAGAILSRNGYKVTVFEKNSFVGGRCSSFNLTSQDGSIFRFDRGASMMFMLETVEILEKKIGLPLNLDFLKCGNTKVSIPREKKQAASWNKRSPRVLPNHVNNSSKKKKKLRHVWLSTDLNQFASLNSSYGERIKSGLYEFLPQGQRFYDMAKDTVLTYNYADIFDLFNYDVLKYLSKIALKNPLALNPAESLFIYMKRIFKDDTLAKAFSLQSMFMGLSPYSALSFYSFLLYDEISSGCFYPKGGFKTIAESLKDIILETGGEIRLSAQVTDIKEMTIYGHKRPLVFFKTKGIEKYETFDKLICNVDFCYAVKHLLPNPYPKLEKTLSSMNFGCSTISFHFALGRRYNFSSHEIYLGSHFKTAFKSIFEQRSLPKIPEGLAFYLHCPSSLDLSASGTKRSCVTALIPVGLTDSQTTTTNLIAAMRSEVLKRTGINESDIVAEQVDTPKTWNESFNLYEGCALGLGHEITQLGPFRPSNTTKYYDWLYFVGASVQPGAGVPTVMYSGMNVAAEVQKQKHETRKHDRSRMFNWESFHNTLRWLREKSTAYQTAVAGAS
eukprot:snap_masked-scaffold_1-processed-gene-3.23-mRNA-1 protein AED:1.00 eAED:1.00 QI:0/-1/0/0/-1/1/1/0/575